MQSDNARLPPYVAPDVATMQPEMPGNRRDPECKTRIAAAFPLRISARPFLLEGVPESSPSQLGPDPDLSLLAACAPLRPDVCFPAVVPPGSDVPMQTSG